MLHVTENSNIRKLDDLSLRYEMKRKLGYLLSVMLILSLLSYGIIKWNRNPKELNKELQKEIKQGTSEGIAKEELVIVTSFYPMYIATLNLVEGVDGVTVINLTENQVGCVHDYQLTTKDMRELVGADIAIINGGELELFMEDVLADHPELKVITASEGFEFLEGTTHSHEIEEVHSSEEVQSDEEAHSHEFEEVHSSEEVHSHEDAHSHEDEDGHEDHIHSAINGHVWMNMDLYQKQLATIATYLSEYDQAHASIYQENLKQYSDKIEALKMEFDEIADLAKGKEIVIFHDAFAYLAQQLGMEVVHAVEIDSETALSAGEISEVIEEDNLHGIQYLFTEEQYSTKIADQIAAETSAKVYVMDSLVTGEDDKDSYLNGMRANLEMLKTVLNYDK